jgi:membrane protease subunit HflC
MMMQRFIPWIIAGFLALITLNGTLFTVSEVEQALVFQFGELKTTHTEPGLKLKIPLIQEVVFYDKRILDFEKAAFELTLQDQKRIIVDVYALFSINDPLLFYKTVGTESVARVRLDAVVTGSIKAILGGTQLSQLISDEREKAMQRLVNEVNRSAEALGVKIVDVRIRRTDLPKENSEAIFMRMKSERESVAREVRAHGSEIAREIRSQADKEREILLAEAEKNAQLTRGQGDAESVRIYAQSLSQDPSFYQFSRSLEAYRNAIPNGETMMILSPKNNFFQYMNGPLKP